VPITPPLPPAAKEVGWDEKEIDRIAKRLASNDLDEDVAMTTLFGPLDPLFDEDVDLIDLEAQEDMPGPSNQGLDLNKEKNIYRIKDTLLKGKGRFETSMRKVAGKCYSSFSRIQKIYRLTCLFALLYMIGFNKALGEIFNDCDERQQGFLLEIPKVVSCAPHMSDEVPYPVNITMWIPRRRPVPLVAYRCYKEIRKTCTETYLTSGKVISDCTKPLPVTESECREVVKHKSYDGQTLVQFTDDILFTNRTHKIDYAFIRDICATTQNFFVATDAIQSYDGVNIVPHIDQK